MKIAGPAIWFIIQGVIYTLILYLVFGLATTLFAPEFYFMVGFTIAAFNMVAGADRYEIYEWIDRQLDKLSGN